MGRTTHDVSLDDKYPCLKCGTAVKVSNDVGGTSDHSEKHACNQCGTILCFTTIIEIEVTYVESADG